MNEMKVFNFEGNEVRMQVVEGEPWFFAKDVTTVLGYSNSSDAISRHVYGEDKGVAFHDTLGGKQNFATVNESGLYALVFGSKLESAVKFKRWVTKDVLPAIRKTGAYQIPMSQEDIMIATLETQKELKKQVTSIASDVEELKTSIHVSASQRHSLKRNINSSVAKHLGGRHSIVYRGLAKKAYSEVYRQLWNYFNITSYAEVPKIKFDEAIQLIDFWVPSAEMRMEISAIQNQIEMEV